jgi:tetratricopeptide (TPR) repeat protein
MTDDILELFERGKKLSGDNETQEAVKIFASLVGLSPNVSDYHAWYAQELNGVEQYEDARREANIAVKLDANSAKGYRQRGHAMIGLGRYEEAVENFSKAIQIDPKEGNPYYFRAQIYNDKLKKYEMAIADYNKALEINPSNSNSYAGRGRSNWNLSKHDNAIQDYSRAIEISPDTDWWFRCRGCIYWIKKDYKSAVDSLSRAIELNPKSADYYSIRASILCDAEEYERYLLDLTRYQDLGGEGIQFSSEGASKEMAVCIEGAKNDFTNNLLPKLKSKNDLPIIWYPTMLLIWGRQNRQVWVNGASFDQKCGYIGQGYICVTRKNIHIVSKGNLAQIIEKSTKNGLSFLQNIFPGGDKTEFVKTDQYWVVPIETIKSSRIINDPYIGQDSVRIMVEDMPWDIYGYWSNQNDITLCCLNMVKAGKFTSLWSNDHNPQMEDSKSPIELLKNLAELRKLGIITEEDFETKKKELLSRI